MRKLTMVLGLIMVFAVLVKYASCNEEGHQVEKKEMVNLAGTLQDIETKFHGMEVFYLKTDNEEIMLLIGPSKYVKEKGFTFAQNDKVEVKGLRVENKNKQAFLYAFEIKKDGKILRLRDEKGRPLWE
jgi:hypothetical protein